MSAPKTWFVLLAYVAGAFSTGASAAVEKAFPDLNLTLSIPLPLDEVPSDESGESVYLGQWSGNLGESAATLTLWAMPTDRYRFESADDIHECMVDYFRSPAIMGSAAALVVTERRYRTGNHGKDHW